MQFVDTHNHLVPDRLVASNFWEIAEYFWLLRHVKAAGYHENAKELPFDERAKIYWEAFQKTENTVWCRVLKSIFSDLFGVELKKASDILTADEAVKQAFTEKRSEELIKKTKLVYYVQNVKRLHNSNGNICVTIPRIEELISEWTQALLDKKDRDFVKKEIASFVSEQDFKGIMSAIPAKTSPTETFMALDMLCEALSEKNMYFELFMGVDDGLVYNPEVSDYYSIFEKHDIPFNILTASERSNIDVVHAGNIYKNVYAGGLWWYNFRPSAYFSAMQYRYENLPMIHSSIIATDARNMEWCYGKSKLVKELLADFMLTEMDKGNLDSELALRICECWLYKSHQNMLGL